MLRIINGEVKAIKIKKNIKKKILLKLKNQKRVPGLAVILIDRDAASKIYVTNKLRACKEVCFLSKKFELNPTINETEIINLIKKLNILRIIDGILIQLPLPQHIKTSKLIEIIKPSKDVDGFHPYNVGKLMQRIPLLRPCTPKGIMTLLKDTNVTLKKKHAVIVGASNIVGRPMIMELLLAGATVTNCHKFTFDLQNYIKKADILIVAIGKPNFIKKEWIREGAIVIDVGINKTKKNKILGDVEFNNEITKSYYLTPVPGGVGPMTIVSLLENTFIAYEINQ